MAVWKARSSEEKQKVQMVDDDSEHKSLTTSEDNGSFLDLGEISMSEVHCCNLPVPVISLSRSKHN